MERSDRWILNCPAPTFGEIAPGHYNCGPMLADDRQGVTPEDNRMQIVSEVSDADFESYAKSLEAAGAETILRNQIGWDKSISCLLNGRTIHAIFFSKRRELRITEDPASCPVADFGYETKGERQTVFYQYGLYYDPDNHMTPRTANCGMLYIIRLSDNSLFMIDGGFILQWNEAAAEGLWRFLREITGSEKVRISAWYFTHTHADHIDGCVKLLNQHHKDIVLERVFCNFPHYEALGGYEISFFLFREQLKKWYPEAKALKIHTGQKFPLADVDIEVFFTHEDGVEKENITRFPFRDGNCMSSILKLTIGGKTLMLLGDTNLESEALLAKYSDPRQWKADLVQVAHHCFNYLDTLYEWIAAPAAVVPNSFGGAHQPENEPKLAAVLKHIEEGKIWYEGGGTDALIPTKEGWALSEHHDLIGGEYDFSGY